VSTRKLILGLGNPILSDDGAGLLLARHVHELLGDPETDLVEAAVAGFKTVQLLTLYDRAVIIDSIRDESAVGEVRRLREEELGGGSSWLGHGLNLHAALELARRLSLPMPQELFIYVIAVKDTHTFGEHLTPEVERAMSDAANKIAAELAALSDYASGGKTPVSAG
jgi:hydrogenase maturation protease